MYIFISISISVIFVLLMFLRKASTSSHFYKCWYCSSLIFLFRLKVRCDSSFIFYMLLLLEAANGPWKESCCIRSVTSFSFLFISFSMKWIRVFSFMFSSFR